MNHNDVVDVHMKIEKENKNNFDIATARILARMLDKISVVAEAVTKGGCT